MTPPWPSFASRPEVPRETTPLGGGPFEGSLCKIRRDGRIASLGPTHRRLGAGHRTGPALVHRRGAVGQVAAAARRAGPGPAGGAGRCPLVGAADVRLAAHLRAGDVQAGPP